MVLHKHWSRSQMVLEHAKSLPGRKLGRVQAAVLKALLENGTYPGTWYWQNSSSTAKTLEGLYKRGLVDTQTVEVTTWRGEPDPLGRTITYYRPVKWMLDAMNAPTENDAENVLESVGR